MPKHHYEATVPRAVLGFCVGVALLAAIDPTAMVTIAKDMDGYPISRLSILPLVATIFVVTFVILLVIVGLTSAPIWVALHRRCWRSWYHAIAVSAAVGFVLMFVRLSLTMLFQAAHWDEPSGTYVPVRGENWHDWLPVAESSLGAGFVGGIIGLIMWRIAYRRISDTSAGEVSLRPSPPPLS